MPDGWEYRYGLNPGKKDGNVDADGDRLSNYEEYINKLNPNNPDCDGDGLNDGIEVHGWSGEVNGKRVAFVSDPWINDTDGDGLDDWYEYYVGTNPQSWDTDGDSLPDAWEVTRGVNAKSDSGDDGAHGDKDKDYLSNYDEYLIGTNPTKEDTDGDGVLDGQEVYGWNAWWYDSSNTCESKAVYSNPLLMDTDGDGLSDLVERNKNLDPANADTDGDGLSDYMELYKGWYVYPIKSIDRLGEILNSFDDENLNIERYHVLSNPHRWDTDKDGLRDGLEYEIGSDPNKVDTDRDGVNDLDEYTWGEDATLVNLEGPEGSVTYEKKSGESGIHWYWNLWDENKISKIVFYKDGKNVGEIDNIDSVKSSGQRYIGIDAGDIFDGATFVFVAYDVLGNARVEKFHLNSMFQVIAYGLGSLLVKYGNQPEIAGRIAGAMRVFEDTGASIAELIDPNNWDEISQGFSDIGRMIRQEGVKGVWNALTAMYEGIVEEYIEDANAIGIDPDNIKFKIGWIEGYIGANILLIFAGSEIGSGITDAFRGSVGAVISKLVESGSKVAEFLDSLGEGIIDLLKAWKGMGLSRHVLLISAAFAAAYGASQIWPEIFGPLFDKGFGFGLMLLSVKGTMDQFGLTEALLDSEAAEGASRLAKRVGESEFKKVAEDAKSILAKEKRAVFLKSLGRGVVSEGNLGDRGFLRKVMRFIKRDSNDILSGSHEVKFFANSKLSFAKPFNDENLKGLIVLKEGTDSWGLKHIVKRHLEDFKKAFGIQDEKELTAFLRDTVENGKLVEWKYDSISGWDLIYEYQGKKIYVVVSENDKGIITAYPYGMR